mgnify:CR=1 FL=1
MNLSVEHVLMFALIVCALYYLMGSCGCKEGYTPSGKPGDCCRKNGDCDSYYCKWTQSVLWDGTCGMMGGILPPAAGAKGDSPNRPFVGWNGICK